MYKDQEVKGKHFFHFHGMNGPCGAEDVVVTRTPLARTSWDSQSIWDTDPLPVMT